jgi:hypothetical protein
MNIDDLISDWLQIDKPVETKPSSFRDRVHNFVKRKEIEKQAADEHRFNLDKVIKAGNDTQAFLNSPWYRTIVEPQLANTIKTGIQTIIREGILLTETDLKIEISKVKNAIAQIQAYKLKVIQGEEAKRAK